MHRTQQQQGEGQVEVEEERRRERWWWVCGEQPIIQTLHTGEMRAMGVVALAGA